MNIVSYIYLRFALVKAYRRQTRALTRLHELQHEILLIYQFAQYQEWMASNVVRRLEDDIQRLSDPSYPPTVISEACYFRMPMWLSHMDACVSITDVLRAEYRAKILAQCEEIAGIMAINKISS
jgi:hypothetical protein